MTFEGHQRLSYPILGYPKSFCCYTIPYDILLPLPKIVMHYLSTPKIILPSPSIPSVHLMSFSSYCTLGYPMNLEGHPRTSYTKGRRQN